MLKFGNESKNNTKEDSKGIEAPIKYFSWQQSKIATGNANF